MPAFTVTEIINTRPWTPAGETEPKTIYYDVKVEGENRPVNVGRKPGNPLTPGAVLEGEITPDDRGGLKFKRAQTGGGGGRGRSPEDEARTRKSIEFQHAQKAGVDVVRLAVENKVWVPETADELTAAVMKVARKLYDQIEATAA